MDYKKIASKIMEHFNRLMVEDKGVIYVNTLFSYIDADVHTDDEFLEAIKTKEASEDDYIVFKSYEEVVLNWKEEVKTDLLGDGYTCYDDYFINGEWHFYITEDELKNIFPTKEEQISIGLLGEYTVFIHETVEYVCEDKILAKSAKEAEDIAEQKWDDGFYDDEIIDGEIVYSSHEIEVE